MRVFQAIAVTASTAIIAAAGYAADQSKEIAKCSAIEGDLARLECFDSLSRRLGLDRPRSASVPTAGTGQWNVTKKVNPVDDSTTVTLVLQAERIVISAAESGPKRGSERRSEAPFRPEEGYAGVLVPARFRMAVPAARNTSTRIRRGPSGVMSEPRTPRGSRVRMGAPAAGPVVRGQWVARVWKGPDRPGRAG